MASLCKGGNEPPDSLKVNFYESFNYDLTQGFLIHDFNKLIRFL